MPLRDGDGGDRFSESAISVFQPLEAPDAMITLNLEKQGESLTFFGEPDPTAPTLEFECSIAPEKSGPEPHAHPRQTETFRIRNGRMHVTIDGEERIVDTGGIVVVEPGQVHTFSNPDPDEILTMRITVEPALNFQWYLSELARSAIRNGGSWKDIPLLEVGYVLNEVRDEHDFPGMSPLLKRILFGSLSHAAVLLRKTSHIAPRVTSRPLA
jgi:mannose-6-phosphate isomerase-like protein (cupin superfamily)